MTNATLAKEKCATGTWRSARTARTFPIGPTPDLMGLLAGNNRDALKALHQAIEEQLATDDHKRRVGERLRSLRERSPYTQEGVADEIGVGLRAYQKMEQTGGVKFDNLQKLATLFKVEVAHFYDDDNAGGQSQLDRIEAKLDQLIAATPTRADMLAVLEEQLQEVADQRSAKRSPRISAKRPAQGGRAE